MCVVLAFALLPEMPALAAVAPVKLANLAHAKILNLAGVNVQVGCQLANTGCAESRAAIQEVAETNVKLPPRKVRRLPAKLPPDLRLGAPFDLRIRSAAAKVMNVWVRQVDTANHRAGHMVDMKSVPVPKKDPKLLPMPPG